MKPPEPNSQTIYHFKYKTMIQLIGKLEVINETETIKGKEFKKRSFVLDLKGEKYPQYLIMEFVQDNVSALDGYSVGDEVTVDINLKGNKWVSPDGVTKYFVTIQAWRISFANEKPKDIGAKANLPF